MAHNNKWVRKLSSSGSLLSVVNMYNKNYLINSTYHAGKCPGQTTTQIPHRNGTPSSLQTSYDQQPELEESSTRESDPTRKSRSSIRINSHRHHRHHSSVSPTTRPRCPSSQTLLQSMPGVEHSRSCQFRQTHTFPYTSPNSRPLRQYPLLLLINKCKISIPFSFSLSIRIK